MVGVRGDIGSKKKKKKLIKKKSFKFADISSLAKVAS